MLVLTEISDSMAWHAEQYRRSSCCLKCLWRAPYVLWHSASNNVRHACSTSQTWPLSSSSSGNILVRACCCKESIRFTIIDDKFRTIHTSYWAHNSYILCQPILYIYNRYQAIAAVILWLRTPARWRQIFGLRRFNLKYTEHSLIGRFHSSVHDGDMTPMLTTSLFSLEMNRLPDATRCLSKESRAIDEKDASNQLKDTIIDI